LPAPGADGFQSHRGKSIGQQGDEQIGPFSRHNGRSRSAERRGGQTPQLAQLRGVERGTGRYRGGADRLGINALRCQQRFHRGYALEWRIVAPTADDDRAQLVEGVFVERLEAAAQTREQLGAADDGEKRWTKHSIDFNRLHSPAKIDVSRTDLLSAYVGKSANRHRDGADRARSSPRIRRNCANRSQCFESSIDLLSRITRKRRSTERLRNRVRGLFRRPGEQVLDELWNELSPFQPAKRSHGSDVGLLVLRSRQLHQKPNVVSLLGAKRIDARRMQIVG
jgi:hypothetical protein